MLRAFQIFTAASIHFPLCIFHALWFLYCISTSVQVYIFTFTKQFFWTMQPFGSQEALRSVRWIGKITLREGMKGSQKPHEILNTFSALFFFSFLSLSFHLPSSTCIDRKPKGFTRWACNDCVLFVLLAWRERCWLSIRRKVWTQFRESVE